MISSAKTLLLATLVFNAATVFGAPIRNVDTSSESVVRSEMNTPVRPIPRAAVIDVEDNRRRSRLGHITRRSGRLVSERDEPLPEAVVVREPEPVVNVVAPIVEARERRYPRRALHEKHEKPKPAVTVLGTTHVPAPPVEARERRYPRRVLHDRYEKREPATSIKETTTVVEKITILDTPEDALAFNANNPSNSASASSTVSTLVSISATTTLASDSSIPTATTSATNSVSASSTASSASATATSDASSTTDSVSATATSTGSSTTDSVSATATPTASSTSTATDSTITASPTSTASSGDPTASASSTSSADGAKASPAGGDAVSVTPPPARSGGDDNPDVRRGIYIRASTEPILRRLAFSGASWASSVKRQLNTH